MLLWLLLLLLPEAIHLLCPWIVCVLWLHELLLGLLHLVEAGLLRLVVAKAASVSILVAKSLLTGRLTVHVIHKACLLRLLLLLPERVSKPVNRSLLLVALVETGGLWRLLLCWRVVE